MLLTGFVKSYEGLVAARFFLGLAEAGLFPGVSLPSPPPLPRRISLLTRPLFPFKVTYLLTTMYPRRFIQLRVGVFFSAATIAGEDLPLADESTDSSLFMFADPPPPPGARLRNLRCIRRPSQLWTQLRQDRSIRRMVLDLLCFGRSHHVFRHRRLLFPVQRYRERQVPFVGGEELHRGQDQVRWLRCCAQVSVVKA